jgi:hypothetical protein
MNGYRIAIVIDESNCNRHDRPHMGLEREMLRLSMLMFQGCATVILLTSRARADEGQLDSKGTHFKRL